ncbi:MFS transporter [Paractinoplanes abujensis]|uniref:DHA1 family inner membrane transport protein n=1 Tax=Paractinoplanes abujensis TaxID=882441 RepID=A0A7W7G3P9_9ACTN|nr:MFS transporter [Actinoplanes abujensis]MBB4695077.1 DHA1 family inner membrane transport protein [Actinoplanes abujensis]GID23809.1 MFS transporter [Actinoplanes abujensis]
MRTRADLTLATLFGGMFVMGSTELLVVGVLDLMAADLRVSVQAAGALVTAYALGLAIGGPVLTALTVRLDRRLILAAALALFALTTLLAIVTTSTALMLVARTVTGTLQGAYIAAAFAVGGAVVPAARAGRAMAVVISGTTVSGALGVPLGTLAGQTLGWRGSFAAAAVLAVAALVATLLLVPSVPGAGGAEAQVRHAFAPPVLAVLALTVLAFASVYAALTYIVPFLATVTGVSGGAVSVFLLAYGVATAAGSFGGGRFADTNAGRALVVGTVGLAISLLTLFVFGAVAFVAGAAVLASGLFAMGMAPSLQYRVVSLAGPGGSFAQSLPASAANVGIALGSLAGGVAVGAVGVSAAVAAGVALAVLAIPVAAVCSRLRPPASPAADADCKTGSGGSAPQSWG